MAPCPPGVVTAGVWSGQALHTQIQMYHTFVLRGRAVVYTMPFGARRSTAKPTQIGHVMVRLDMPVLSPLAASGRRGECVLVLLVQGRLRAREFLYNAGGCSLKEHGLSPRALSVTSPHPPVGGIIEARPQGAPRRGAAINVQPVVVLEQVSPHQAPSNALQSRQQSCDSASDHGPRKLSSFHPFLTVLHCFPKYLEIEYLTVQ